MPFECWAVRVSTILVISFRLCACAYSTGDWVAEQRCEDDVAPVLGNKRIGWKEKRENYDAYFVNTSRNFSSRCRSQNLNALKILQNDHCWSQLNALRSQLIG